MDLAWALFDIPVRTKLFMNVGTRDGAINSKKIHKVNIIIINAVKLLQLKFVEHSSFKTITNITLRKKCPNTEIFLVRIFLYSL